MTKAKGHAMSPERFSAFSRAYELGLLRAVQAKPANYMLRPGQPPEDFAAIVAAKMLADIAERGSAKAVNATSAGFRNACKILGIKHTYKAMDAFLAGS